VAHEIGNCVRRAATNRRFFLSFMRCCSKVIPWRNGSASNFMTPDQKVACSSHVVVKRNYLLTEFSEPVKILSYLPFADFLLKFILSFWLNKQLNFDLIGGTQV
jgi:hypothetical protein